MEKGLKITDAVYDNNTARVDAHGRLVVTLKQAVELIKQGASIDIEELSKEDKRILYRVLQTQDGVERAVARLQGSDTAKEGA